MFKKTPAPIELKNLKEPAIKQENVHMRADWVHLVFNTIDDAEKAGVELSLRGLVRETPNIHKTHQGQPYGLGKFFMRIHPTAFENIAVTYDLSTRTAAPGHRSKS